MLGGYIVHFINFFKNYHLLHSKHILKYGLEKATVEIYIWKNKAGT